jgi:hypothetical protein
MIQFKEYFLINEVNDNTIPNSKEIFDNLFKEIRSIHAYELKKPTGSGFKTTINNHVKYELEKAYGEYFKFLPKKLIDVIVYEIYRICIQKYKDPFIAYRNMLTLDYPDKINEYLETKSLSPKVDTTINPYMSKQKRYQPRTSEEYNFKSSRRPKIE